MIGFGKRGGTKGQSEAATRQHLAYWVLSLCAAGIIGISIAAIWLAASGSNRFEQHL